MNKTILNLTRTWGKNSQVCSKDQACQNETYCYNRHRKGGLKAFCHHGPYMLDMYKSFGAFGNPEHYAIIIQRSWRKLKSPGQWDYLKIGLGKGPLMTLAEFEQTPAGKQIKKDIDNKRVKPAPVKTKELPPYKIDKNFFFFESLKQPGCDIPYEECDLHRSARLLQRKWRKWSGHVFHYFYDCLAPEEVLDRSARLIQRRWQRWNDWNQGGPCPPQILLIDFELRPEFGSKVGGECAMLCDMCKDPMRKNGTLSICLKCSEDKPTPVIEEDPPDWNGNLKIAAVAIIRMLCQKYNGDTIRNSSVTGRWISNVYTANYGHSPSKFAYSVLKDIASHFKNQKIGSYECNETKMIERYDSFHRGTLHTRLLPNQKNDDEELFTDNIVNVPTKHKPRKVKPGQGKGGTPYTGKYKKYDTETGSPPENMVKEKKKKVVSPQTKWIQYCIKHDLKIEIEQKNPKKKGSKVYDKYELFKSATTFKELIELGGSRGDYMAEFKSGNLVCERTDPDL